MLHHVAIKRIDSRVRALKASKNRVFFTVLASLCFKALSGVVEELILLH
jgi:hypothetical protein